MKTLQLNKDLYWVGNLDPDLAVFDIIMFTEFGTTYNSYVLKGSEKTVLFETSKLKCFDEYLSKVTDIVSLDKIDYIIVDHTEPDHAGSIEKLLDLNPRIKLVGSGAAIGFLKEICNRDFTSVIVKDGDSLSLGNKTLRFISAPNLHWPDTIYTYIEEDHVLVTCDSFGAHYSFEGITNDKITNQDDYMKALRYYFDNIIGPFKSFALQAIDKIKDLQIDTICPGHGPVLVENPRKIVDIYKEWSTEVNPNGKKTVVIPYVSAYGYTEMMANKIEEGIKASGDIDVKKFDLVTSEQGTVLGELYWADGILLGTPTIVGDALKPIWDLTTCMFARTHGGKIASAFGSYGWSGEGVPNLLARLRQLNMKVYGDGLRIKFKPSAIQLQDAFEFGYNFGKSVAAGKIVEPAKSSGKKKIWKCLVCGELIEGDEPPAVCPVCGVGPEQFVEVELSDITFKSSKDEKFVIIGNGAAATTACEEIRKRNAVCSIELISEENVIGYNRPMLTKGILTEIDMLNLFIKPFSWYQENNIKVTTGVRAVQIKPENKSVVLSNGETRGYDKLILATGAKSFIPPIKGVEHEGVFAIRSLSDVNEIQAYLPKVRDAVVIGGGVLGLEAAWELKKAGKEVTVIEMSPQIMGRQLDSRGSELLREAVEKAGIKVITGTGIEAIEGGGATGMKLEDGTVVPSEFVSILKEAAEKAGIKVNDDSSFAQSAGKVGVSGVRLKDGTLIPAQIVTLSTGVKPNTELAAAIGIPTGRAIVVNEKMETGIEGIYACGDCAEFEGVCYGIWSQAIDMGRAAGINAVGDEAVYTQVTPSNAYNGMNTSLFAIGDPGKDADKKYKTFELYDEAKGTYEKLYFSNNRFCGGILIGDVSKSAKLLEGYQNQEPIAKFL